MGLLESMLDIDLISDWHGSIQPTWAGGLVCYKKADWESHEKKPVSSIPPSLGISFCNQVPPMTAFDDELLYRNVSKINHFLPK